jgi:peptidoglycan/xylan/chitin deacetylase (PgdA/CDA1 family)
MTPMPTTRTTTNTFWPKGAQCAVTITVNFAGESVEQSVLPGQPLWGRYSYGRYGAQVGIGRLLDALAHHDVRATFFIPGWDVERYPEVMRRIAEAGHEPAAMGYAHENFSALPVDRQDQVLARTETAFQHAFGVRPQGWRAPEGLMSLETRGILAARGYRYDSSYNDDDLPYVVELDGKRIAELPVFWSSSDRYYYASFRSPEIVAAALVEEFHAMYAAGGLCNLILHPRGDYGSGRAVRVAAVEHILQRIREYPRVWLATCAEVAQWTLERESTDA